MKDHEVLNLKNGTRLVLKNVNNTKIVHCGIILDLGTRDEPSDLQGLAHFLEHMAFKRTRTRNSYHIINSLESVGGELNAFTTKEKICFHASVLDEYFEKAVDLLTDITFHSTFPQKEIDKERRVILDEMFMYRDLPEDSIQDDFDNTLFRSHPLGRNILGKEDAVGRIRHQHFIEFIRNNLNSNRVVFTVVGNIKQPRYKAIVDKYFDKVPVFNGKNKRLKPGRVKSNLEKVSKNITRSYCAMGYPAYSISSIKRLKLFMLINILGGPSMNSRLNMELRERRGLVYSVDASYMPYTDSGIAAIYFGTDNLLLNKSIDLVHREIDKLKNNILGKLQLHKAKEQLVGQLAIAEENNASLMIMMGRSLLDLDRIDPLDEIIREIRSFSATDLADVANEIFDDSGFCQLLYEPA